MSAKDISRFLFQPQKRYSSVRMQQGRVILDSDWNESERIDDEEARRTQAEVICSKGTPNEGFLVTGVTDATVTAPPQPGSEIPAAKETYDFQWGEGSFYLGGLRFETDAAGGERFLQQADWAIIDADLDNVPSRPTVSDLTDAEGNFVERFDLIYLRGWEQCVTAVEDSELLERALGGPDTSTRMRRTRRVQVLENVPGECADAFEALTAHVMADVDGSFDDSGCELLSNARLTVSPAGDGGPGHPCKPQAVSGYLGAENQAIRVQLTAQNRFIWGYDNAAPYYRVQVLPQDGAFVKIKFLTLPRDQAAQPLKGQAVEIHPWQAMLPNQEKIAELQGHLAAVATSYDPDDQSLTISTPVPQAWLNWLDDPAHAAYLSDRDSEDNQKYFYLRVWTGASGDATEPDHAFTAGTAVGLAGTGLNVTFSTNGIPGDFWIIAARPNTPDVVVPWELATEAPPAGTRFFAAALALVRWSVDATAADPVVVSHVHDCRHKFRPLCQATGCCTITVGDGHVSFGDVNSIQQAVQMLPDGGEICVLPGRYREQVLLSDKRNITIRGCGRRTRLLEEEGGGGPIIDISNSVNIAVHSLALAADTVDAIRMQGDPEHPLERIMLADLEITCRDRSAIFGRGGRLITVLNNRVTVSPLAVEPGEESTAGRQAAVFLTGSELLIENNRIVGEIGERRELAANGGLHIGGGSEHVTVLGNVIAGGNGNGVTLGSFRYVPAQAVEDFSLLTGFSASPLFGVFLTIDALRCIRIDPNPAPPVDEDGNPLVPVADEALSDVRIADNDIAGMGASGISVARFFDLTTNPDFITVDRLTIEENRIRDCMRLKLADLDPAYRQNAGHGGIALADGEYLIVRGNTIERNGTDHLDPICGVFILHGEGITVDGNRILHNGRPADPELTPLPGQRGGIVIGMAKPRTEPVEPFGTGFSGSRQDGVPAARVHGNIVVSPEGRALKIVAIGPVTVEGNQLTAHGSNSLARVPLPGTTTTGNAFIVSDAAAVPYANLAATTNPLAAFLDALGGAVVSIVNLGVSNEFYLQLFGLSGLGLVDSFPAPTEQGEDARLFVGGNILFNDNQVVFDAYGPTVTLSMSSVLLFSLDDVSMTGNQCDCDLVLDLVGVNALVFAWSARVEGNRFKEGILNALLSAFTLGLMNATTSNQGTHCFLAVGSPVVSVLTENRSLVEYFNEELCDSFDQVSKQVGRQIGFLTESD